MYVFGFGVVGYFLLKYWIICCVEVCKEEIIYGFFDSLDMMFVCVEVG